MPFLPPNQQSQSTEGSLPENYSILYCNLLSWPITVFQVNELGGASGGGGKGGAKQTKGKDKDAPPFSEVRDECKLYVDADIGIPLPLMARLIKFRLLIIKDTDIKNRKACNVYSISFGSVHLIA